MHANRVADASKATPNRRKCHETSFALACAGTVVVAAIVLTMSRPAAAQRSWDDAGGSASKLWSDFGNWNPDGTPSGEPITIGNLAAAANDTTIVDQNFAIDSLTLSNGADVDTDGNELIVNGVTTLGGAGTFIYARPRTTGDMDSLDSQGIVVNSGAFLSLLGETGSTAGGIVELESGLFEINAGGNAGGHGTIQLINSSTVGQALENSGRLYVAGRPGQIIGFNLPGTLTITNGTTGTGTIDLDGDSEAGFVDVDDDSGGIILGATSLTLNIEVPIADSFGGQMDIGNGDTVNITNPWTINPGTLNLLGTGTHTVAGGTLTVSGATAPSTPAPAPRFSKIIWSSTPARSRFRLTPKFSSMAGRLSTTPPRSPTATTRSSSSIPWSISAGPRSLPARTSTGTAAGSSPTRRSSTPRAT